MLPKIAITLCQSSGIGQEIIQKSLTSPFLNQCEASIFTNIKEKFPIKTHFVDGNDRSVIEQAALSCIRNEYQALLTLPAEKNALGGVGHTEILSSLSNVKTTMFFTSPTLKVALATTHQSLKSVSAALNFEKVTQTITQTHEALKKLFKIQKPTLYLAALNPHAGEGELIGGVEEKEILIPALNFCKSQGINIEGPFSSDSLFHKAIAHKTDAVIALYHDQGLIPLKLLHFFDSAGITLGLPYLRVSVDHGTAPDIVGKNLANPSSFLYALKLTLNLLKNETQS